MPVVSIMSLNLLGKMGFGALGGFEYVAIHAGECRNPVRTIGRSVVIAAPIIAVMFILGTSSVLALVPPDRIDLIAPIPQVLSERASARSAWRPTIAPMAILALLVHPRRAVERDVRGQHAAADGRRAGTACCRRGSPGCIRAIRTPANSIVFVGAVTLAFSIVGLVGVGKQEAFQLLWNASGIFYALTYLVMFAIPLAGRPGDSPRAHRSG